MMYTLYFIQINEVVKSTSSRDIHNFPYFISKSDLNDSYSFLISPQASIYCPYKRPLITSKSFKMLKF